ncbi:birch protein [Fagus crenata]
MRDVKVLNDIGGVISRDSEGWMEVKDHFVLSGAATTRQSFSYRDEFRTLDAARQLQKRVMANKNNSPAPAKWVNGQHPYDAVLHPVTPFVEDQKPVTIRNDVNIKESLRLEPDEEIPGHFLVVCTLDATALRRYYMMLAIVF